MDYKCGVGKGVDGMRAGLTKTEEGWMIGSEGLINGRK